MDYAVSLDADRYSALRVNIACEYGVGDVDLLTVLEEMADRAALEMLRNPVKQLTITVERI